MSKRPVVTLTQGRMPIQIGHLFNTEDFIVGVLALGLSLYTLGSLDDGRQLPTFPSTRISICTVREGMKSLPARLAICLAWILGEGMARILSKHHRQLDIISALEAHASQFSVFSAVVDRSKCVRSPSLKRRRCLSNQ